MSEGPTGEVYDQITVTAEIAEAKAGIEELIELNEKLGKSVPTLRYARASGAGSSPAAGASPALVEETRRADAAANRLREAAASHGSRAGGAARAAAIAPGPGQQKQWDAIVRQQDSIESRATRKFASDAKQASSAADKQAASAAKQAAAEARKAASDAAREQASAAKAASAAEKAASSLFDRATKAPAKPAGRAAGAAAPAGQLSAFGGDPAQLDMFGAAPARTAAGRATRGKGFTSIADARAQAAKDAEANRSYLDRYGASDEARLDTMIGRRKVARSRSLTGIGEIATQGFFGTEEDMPRRRIYGAQQVRMLRDKNPEEAKAIKQGKDYLSVQKEIDTIDARHRGPKGAAIALGTQMGTAAMTAMTLTPALAAVALGFEVMGSVATQSLDNILDSFHKVRDAQLQVAGSAQSAGGTAGLMASLGLSGNESARNAINQASSTANVGQQSQTMIALIASMARGSATGSGGSPLSTDQRNQLQNSLVQAQNGGQTVSIGGRDTIVPNNRYKPGETDQQMAQRMFDIIKNTMGQSSADAFIKGWNSGAGGARDDAAFKGYEQAALAYNPSDTSQKPRTFSDLMTDWTYIPKQVKRGANGMAMDVPADVTYGDPKYYENIPGAKSQQDMQLNAWRNLAPRNDFSASQTRMDSALSGIASGQFSLTAPMLGQTAATREQLAILSQIPPQIVAQASAIGQTLAADRQVEMGLQRQSNLRSYTSQQIGFQAQLASSQLRLVDLSTLQAEAAKAGLSPAAAMVGYYQNQLDILSRQETLAERQLSRNQLFGNVAVAETALPGQNASDRFARIAASRAQLNQQQALWGIQDRQFNLGQSLSGAQATSGMADSTYGYKNTLISEALSVKQAADQAIASSMSTYYTSAFTTFKEQQKGLFDTAANNADTSGVSIGSKLADSTFASFARSFQPQFFKLMSDLGISNSAGGPAAPMSSQDSSQGLTLNITWPDGSAHTYVLKVVNGALIDQSHGLTGGRIQ